MNSRIRGNKKPTGTLQWADEIYVAAELSQPVTTEFVLNVVGASGGIHPDRIVGSLGGNAGSIVSHKAATEAIIQRIRHGGR